ncbi:Histone-lysine N-methyltransferase SETMAR [Araneus ventricosus]|uniref:Histone-lysine N-methyltransferase SETMAR n=1 Tax=Araneus ventricosus TaxID=182803 RepID=A0A4Y2V020_ARAVE|nr:Histone-lysine N-methyltransferase SETMAR [Araneus ventricosus]
MNHKLQHMCSALVNRGGPTLLHNNAGPHLAQRRLQRLNKLGYETLPHPPCSRKRTPLFKPLDNFLKQKVFNKQSVLENVFLQLYRFQNVGILS